MKAFTERNPYLIGAIVVTLVLAVTGGSLVLSGGKLKPHYTVKAIFPDSAGMSSGAKVLVAGIKEGQVSKVKRAIYRDNAGKRTAGVEFDIQLYNGAHLPKNSTAHLVLETALGNKFVSITAPPPREWKGRLAEGDHIEGDPQLPADLNSLATDSKPALTKTDGRAINRLLGEVASITKGRSGDLRTIITGLNRLLKVVDDRKGEAAQLIESTRSVMQNLAANRQTIDSALTNFNSVVENLAERRDELADVLTRTAAVSGKIHDLVRSVRPDLDSFLSEIRRDLDIVGQHQLDTAQSLSNIASGVRGLASQAVAGNPPQDITWVNFYLHVIGPLDQDAIYGSCGVLDNILDATLGNDPRPCSARTGPSPYNNVGQSTGTSVNATGLGSKRHNPVAQLFDPLVQP